MNYPECKYPRGALAIYAKAPVLGRVKTRLQGFLGEEGALSLHKSLIRYVFENLAQARLCATQLWVAGQADAPTYDPQEDAFFLGLCAREAIVAQQGADLGERMAHTARQALTQADYVVIVGADCPSVDASYLEAALQALEAGASIVFGPADDGGYVLLGLRELPECLFVGVPWGSSEVLAVSRANLRANGWQWTELEPRWDVDRPQDLVRLQALDDSFIFDSTSKA